MSKKLAFILFALTPFVLPAVAHGIMFGNVILNINLAVGALIPLFLTLALVYIAWAGVILVRSTDEAARKQARQHLTWGFIGIFLMISIWGVVNVIIATTGITPVKNPANVPSFYE